MSNDTPNNEATDAGASPVGNPDNVDTRVTESDPNEVTEIEATTESGTGLRSTLRNFTDRYVRSGIQPKQVTPKLFDDIENAVADGGGRLLRVDPNPENESVAAAESLFQELHDARMKWFNLVNASETHGFEIWFNDGKLSFYFYVRSERAEKKFKKQIDAYYPKAKIVPIHGNPRRELSELKDRPDNSEPDNDDDNDERKRKSRSWWDERFPPIYDGDYVAAAQLKKKLSPYYPLRSTKGIIQMKEDPYKAITSEILSDDLDRTMIQVVFKPANPNWADGKLGADIIPTRTNSGNVAEHLKEEKFKNNVSTDLRDPSQREMQLSEKVMEFSEQNAYHTNVRVISFSPHKNEARQNVWSLSTAFERSYEETAGDGETQSFQMVPGAGTKINEIVLRSARREWNDCKTILTVPELAGVAHVPNETIETPAVTWNQTGKGARPPADMPRFDDPPKRLPPGVQLRQTPDEDNDDPPENADPSDNTPSEERKGTEETHHPHSEPQQQQDTDSVTDEESIDAPDSDVLDTESKESGENTPEEQSEPTDTTPSQGFIESRFPSDTDTDTGTATDAFPSSSSPTDTPDGSEPDKPDKPNNNTTGEEPEKTTSPTTTTTDTPTAPTDTSTDTDTGTTDREDPNTDTTDTSNSEISSGYNKNVAFGNLNDNDNDNDEEEDEDTN